MDFNCARISFWSQLYQNICGDNCEGQGHNRAVGPRQGGGRVLQEQVDGSLPDGGGGLEDVKVLQDVRNCHQPQSSQEPES